MTCADRYQELVETIASICDKAGRPSSEVQLVAISKRSSVQSIREVYEAGCRDFGENRVQEWLAKKAELPSDIAWHFVGNLQRKKVRLVACERALIHSVDSLELARKISAVSASQGCKARILLEANTSGEPSKAGQTPEQWLADSEALASLPALSVEGLMTMAPLTDDRALIRKTFERLRLLRDAMRSHSNGALPLPHLSMGMSRDYPIAIEEGATLLRVGTAIFG